MWCVRTWRLTISTYLWGGGTIGGGLYSRGRLIGGFTAYALWPMFTGQNFSRLKLPPST